MPDDLKKCLKNPLYLFWILRERGFLNWIPDSLFLKAVFRTRMGYPLNLKNPQTFNEKISWLKLYGNLEQYTNLADKYEVRKYISHTIGEQYLIPLLGVWDRFEDIDFSKLPEQFVLKCNHDSGSIIICKNKDQFDIKAAKRKLNACLKRNMSYLAAEPQYKNIKPRIMGEKFMIDESGSELKDYKVWCFHGSPKLIQITYDRCIYYDRCTGTKINFYDTEWNFVPASWFYPSDPNVKFNKPGCLEEMLELARILSKDYLHVRVDFYAIFDRIYFGELTFTSGAGFSHFKPLDFDREVGSWLNLPTQTK